MKKEVTLSFLLFVFLAILRMRKVLHHPLKIIKLQIL
jgi:hypothetical protein